MGTESNLVEQTQRDILSMIAEGGNTSLPREQDLTEILGVSRVVIREALSRLRAVGLIETKRKAGSRVVAPDVFGVMKTIISTGLLDRNTLKDLYQLRLMLEIGMADYVVAGKTPAQMEELDKIVAEEVKLNAEMSKVGSKQEKLDIAAKLIKVDVAFHAKLFEMTGNKSLMDFQDILRHLFTLYFPRIKTDYHDQTIVSHVGLYNILRTDNANAFREAMRLHLKTQFDNMDAILSNVPDNTRKNG